MCIWEGGGVQGIFNRASMMRIRRRIPRGRFYIALGKTVFLNRPVQTTRCNPSRFSHCHSYFNMENTSYPCQNNPVNVSVYCVEIASFNASFLKYDFPQPSIWRQERLILHKTRDGIRGHSEETLQYKAIVR